MYTKTLNRLAPARRLWKLVILWGLIEIVRLIVRENGVLRRRRLFGGPLHEEKHCNQNEDEDEELHLLSANLIKQLNNFNHVLKRCI